jgi:hypothetical protein
LVIRINLPNEVSFLLGKGGQMPAEPSASHQNDLDRWLQSLGFGRGNPFATAEADQERTLLPEFYINVDSYERIKGDRTLIVFAPRGGGKSALRVMLSSQAAPISPEATTLAVEYTDFDRLITKQRTGQSLTIEDHLQRLLKVGVQALLNTFCGDPTVESSEEERAKDRQLRATRITSLMAPTRSRLSHLLRLQYPTLLNPEMLYERYQILDPTFAPSWLDFVKAVTERRLYEFLAHSSLETNEIARLLADLNDYPETLADSIATPTEQLKSFVYLAHAAGLTTVQFLVDRLDENPETANDPQAQADILEPLLAHLLLLETPGIAFKFFLSREVRDILLVRPTIRRDRLTDQAVTVAWDKHRLRQLLNERLAVYSEGQVSELTQLCQEIRVEIGRGQASRLLGEWLEDEILQLAQHSPRRLLVAMQLLSQAHVRQNGPTGLIKTVDWETAKTELMQKMPPILRLQRTVRLALVGDRKIDLTQQQHKILLTLADNFGRCKRQMLVETVWGTPAGVSDEAIDQAIGRLREKLADNPDTPVYLRTQRGEGFELLNYEVEQLSD